MSSLPETCRKLTSIKKKLQTSLHQPPHSAGYVQQLLNIALEILEEADVQGAEQMETSLKAREGMKRAIVLADKFDELSLKATPLYTMADVVQPALEAVNRYLVTCSYQ